LEKKRVDDFLYLESKIDENEGTLLDIQQRINKARGAFSRLKNIRRNWGQYLDGLAEEAQSAALMKHISQVYKAIKKLS
jgi:hypothetical protein